MNDIGKVAYDAWCNHAVLHRETVIAAHRAWLELSMAEKDCWRAAARAVVALTRDETSSDA